MAPIIGTIGAGSARGFGRGRGISKPLNVRPPYTASGTSIGQLRTFNGGKGLWMSANDIYSDSARSLQTGYDGSFNSNSQNWTIPDDLWWCYAIVIGGGGGGDGNGSGWGGSGGGWVFAKLDLRSLAGQTLSLSSGIGGSQNGNGGTSSISASGLSVTANGGTTDAGRLGITTGSGGSASGGNVVTAFAEFSGGTTSGAGRSGATGGGGRAGSQGGQATKPWGSGGSGGDSSYGGAAGSFVWSYAESWNSDTQTGLTPLSSSIVNSLYQSVTFFNDRNSSTYGNGRAGRSTTTHSNTAAGFFGAGGGGSSSGSGFRGGPGLIALWW
jgi:hypothetical protein